MKVLFVCVGNMGRSQIAEALFDQMSTHNATSAGTRVGDKEGQSVGDRSRESDAPAGPANMIRIMKEEESLDLEQKVRKQLMPEMVREADRVVVMCQSDPYPDYLDNDPKVTFWNIEDLYGTPDANSYEAMRQVKEEVKRHVAGLISQIG